MNVKNNSLTMTQDSLVILLEGFRLSVSSVWKCCLVKFNEFFGNWFFIFKKRMDLFQDVVYRFSSKFPKNLIPKARICRVPSNEVHRTSQSRFYPIEKIGLGVVALQNDFVDRVRSSSGSVVLDTQAAFSVYKSCKVGEVALGDCGSFGSFFKNVDVISGNQEILVLRLVHSLDDFFSFLDRLCFKKRYKEHRLISLLQKMWNHLCCKISGVLTSNRKMVGRFLLGSLCFSRDTNCSSKGASKTKENVLVGGTDIYSTVGLPRVERNMEASITIHVPTNIKNVYCIFVVHTVKYAMSKSLKVIESDNPTEPAVSDFATLNSQLDTANAFKFMTGKLGEDRFGSQPVRSRYLMFANTLLERTFDEIDDFTNSWNYPNNLNILYPEYGSVLNFSILTSSNASISAAASMNGATVFNNIAAGRESFAHIQQDGYSMKLLYRAPIFSGPLALNGTLGVKFMQAQIITQDTWISNFRCTAAA